MVHSPGCILLQEVRVRTVINGMGASKDLLGMAGASDSRWTCPSSRMYIKWHRVVGRTVLLGQEPRVKGAAGVGLETLHAEGDLWERGRHGWCCSSVVLLFKYKNRIYLKTKNL